MSFDVQTEVAEHRAIALDYVGSRVAAPRILMVEDNREHAKWILDMIRDGGGEGYEIAWVGNLAQAVYELENTRVDLVLLDLGLPDLAGFKCQLVVHHLAPNVPVVVLTGDDRSRTRDLAGLSGAKGFLLKTEATPHMLNQAIREAIQNQG